MVEVLGSEAESLQHVIGKRLRMEILSVTLVDGRLEVVRREKMPQLAYDPPRPTPDKVWKDIYKGNAGEDVYLDETIDGTHTPATTAPEKTEFPGEPVAYKAERGPPIGPIPGQHGYEEWAAKQAACCLSMKTISALQVIVDKLKPEVEGGGQA